VGDLPCLTQLILIGCQIFQLPHKDVHTRVEKFGRLADLTTFTTFDSFDVFMNTYFSNALPALSRIEAIFRTPGGDGGQSENFECLSVVASTLRELLLTFFDAPTQLLNISCIGRLEQCHRLEALCVESDKFFSSSGTDLGELFGSWWHLWELHLTKSARVSDMDLTPEELRDYSGAGLDLSCLAVLAENLTRLQTLHITLLACDTRQFQDNLEMVHSFKNLDEFKLGNSSLANWRRPGFNQHEAASYISILLLSSTSVLLEPISTRNKKEWVGFEEEYGAFIHSFVERVENYMKIRDSQSVRIQHLRLISARRFMDDEEADFEDYDGPLSP
jgi:hypothetical protein